MAKLERGVNDLATLRPDLAKEWHPTKNGNLKPSDVTVGKRGKFWWYLPYDDPKTGKHFDFEWEASIGNRVVKSGCPFISGQKIWRGFNDLATLRPDLVEEWHPVRNGELTPYDVTCGSSQKVIWKCKNCGFEWEASVSLRVSGNSCYYCKKTSGKKVKSKLIEGVNDLATLFPSLVEEWDYEKNGELVPSKISAGSKKIVFWKCQFCGNIWESSVSGRTSGGYGCPKCNIRFQTSFPEQAIYYYINLVFSDAINRYDDLGKELDIYIPSIRVGIEYDGYPWHAYEDTIKNDIDKNNWCKKENITLYRIREERCPDILGSTVIKTDSSNICLERAIIELFSLLNLDSSGINVIRDALVIKANYFSRLKENSLAMVYPEISKEWDYENNQGLTPDMFFPKSSQKVYWKCSYCGNSWKARIADRTKGHGCMKCSRGLIIGGNDLATLHPDLLKDWDYDRNVGLDPKTLMAGSHKKVMWKCHKCGYKWEAPISRRALGRGCVRCSNGLKIGENDVASLYPELVGYWDYAKNKELLPQAIHSGSKKKVFWKCQKCGDAWEAPVYVMSKRVYKCKKCRNTDILLSQKYPDLFYQLDKEKNEGVYSITIENQEVLYWRCPLGHSYQMTIQEKRNGKCCPECENGNTKENSIDLYEDAPE